MLVNLKVAMIVVVIVLPQYAAACARGEKVAVW